MHEYLSPGRFIDSDHPAVVEFAEQHRGASNDPREQAIRRARGGALQPVHLQP